MSDQHDSLEIEIKVQIENSKKLLAFLKEKAKLVAKEHQIDTYYTPAHRNFIEVSPIKEWLRLRDADGVYSINYKNWHYEADGKSHYCDEYESEVKDYKSVELILKALDMKLLVSVEKTRQLWKYQDYEIALDQVKDLGNFVEIEFKGEIRGKSPVQATEEMINFLEKLDCGELKRDFKGYPYQLLFPD